MAVGILAGYENSGRDRISARFVKPQAGIGFPSEQLRPRTPYTCQGFRSFGAKSIPAGVSHFRLHEFWANSSLAAFWQPRMRKHRPGWNLLNSLQLNTDGPIDARTSGISGKFDPCQCFRMSGFTNFGDIFSLAALFVAISDAKTSAGIELTQDSHEVWRHRQGKNSFKIHKIPHRCNDFRNFAQTCCGISG